MSQRGNNAQMPPLASKKADEAGIDAVKKLDSKFAIPLTDFIARHTLFILLCWSLIALSACPEQERFAPDAGPDSDAPAAVVDAGSATNRFLEVSGIVIDQNDEPVAGAWIMQGGRAEERIINEDDGTFTFTLEDPGWGISVLVAAKPGAEPSAWNTLFRVSR